MLNNWSEAEVKRAESTWGHKTPQYTLDMFDFLINTELGITKSYLDLGCGFGRFLEYLMSKDDEANYVGYDSSPSMLDRIRERFPEYSFRTFQKSITDPIVHPQHCVLCSAVLIHITEADQLKVLENVKKAQPRLFTFDINCQENLPKPFVERQIRLTESNFRMSWQKLRPMMDKTTAVFGKTYDISFKEYTLGKDKTKNVFFLAYKS